jgi:LuxR family quorum sensing-dependent transcriptional regulator
MADVTQRFAQALDQVRTIPAIDQLWPALKEFAAELGYVHVAGVDAARLAGGAADATFYTDAPDVAPQIDRAYTYAQAPFVQRALRSPDTFLISELRDDPKTHGPWADLLAGVIRRGDGLIVPVYEGDDPVAGFVFGGEKPDTSPLARAMLQVLAHATFLRYRTLKSAKRPFTPHGLTTREIQCLRAAAAGKGDTEVGADLGISSRTVRFHIDGAKGKLKANSRVQAIAKALQEKIIAI